MCEQNQLQKTQKTTYSDLMEYYCNVQCSQVNEYFVLYTCIRFMSYSHKNDVVPCKMFRKMPWKRGMAKFVTGIQSSKTFFVYRGILVYEQH